MTAPSHQGEVAIVTGGGRGVGLAIARGLADRDAQVAVFDRSLHDLRSSGESRGLATFEVDIVDDEAVQSAVAQVRDQLGPVGILVNNAGISESKSIMDSTLDDFNRAISVNLLAPFMLVKAVVGDMISRSRGRIVNVASSSIYTNVANKSAYMASKAGLLGLTSALANDLGRYGITVNAVSPGLTRTPMVEQQMRDGQFPEELYSRLVSVQAIPRAAEVDDLVGTVLFLTGEGSAMVTAQFIAADGGLTRHF